MIGLAGQFAAVEPAMTGRENLEMVARLFGMNSRAAKASAAAVLDQLGLLEDGDRLARTYSGGMRRRLDLGASLVGAPRLLLLDEPTTGLDPRSRIELWEAIRTLVEAGTDVLLTTQYLDEADHLASQIVIIDHGRAVAAGTPPSSSAGSAATLSSSTYATPSTSTDRRAARLARHSPRSTRPPGGSAFRSTPADEQLMSALRSLDAAGIELEDIALRQPNLDEVFLALTGRPAETHDAMAAHAA